MDYIRLLTICVVLALSERLDHVEADECSSGKYQTTKYAGKRLANSGNTAQTVVYPQTLNQATCQNKCTSHVTFHCKAYNYEANQKLCEILSTDSQNSVSDQQGWDFYDINCTLPTPEATPETTPEGSAEDDGAQSEILRDLETFYEWLQTHPEYVAMAGMGLVIILLFIIILVILCQYTGRKKSDKYREKE